MNIIDWIKININSGIRTVINPITSIIMNLKYNNAKKPILWDNIKHLPIKEYSDLINSYKYRKDGLFDSTILNPEDFFQNRDSERDCDDFAQMWVWWAVENDFVPQKLMIWEKDNEFKTCHMTVILRDRRPKYFLCDYHYNDTAFDTFEQCFNEIKKKYNFKNELIWAYNN